MRILLINPPWYHGAYSNTIAAAAGFSPPVSIAAYLRINGHEVRIIDANTEKISLF